MAGHVARVRTLDTDAVLAAALKLADAKGIDALTMRRLAGELGVTPMALYNHVENKGALIDLMGDHAMAELPAINPGGGWRGELQRFFIAYHRQLVAHPALAEAVLRRPKEGPVAEHIADGLLGLMLRTGFTDAGAVSAVLTLFNYTCGAANYRLTRARPGGERLGGIDAAGAPDAHRLRGRLAHAASDAEFKRGLDTILSGIEASVS
jgi:AcrR family transcriptional regulator